MKKRFGMTVIGLFFLAVGMGLFKAVNLGIDPYSGLATELAVFLQKLGLEFCSYSFVFSVLTAILFVWIFFWDRHFMNMGTVIHILFVGKLTEITQNIAMPYLEKSSLGVRIFVLMIAFIIFTVASAVYYSADLGVSAYDAVSLALADKGVMEYQYARILTDCICLICGMLLGVYAVGFQSIWGAQLGIGTLLVAFCMGPAVQFLRRFFES